MTLTVIKKITIMKKITTFHFIVFLNANIGTVVGIRVYMGKKK